MFYDLFMKTYRRKEVQQITGIPARRIQFYTDNGIIIPEKTHTGKGIERRYSRKNLLELLIVKELAAHKVELSRIKKIIVTEPDRVSLKTINQMFDPDYHSSKNLWGCYLYIYEKEFEYVGQVDPKTLKKSERLTVDMKGHPSVLIINIGNLCKKLSLS